MTEQSRRMWNDLLAQFKEAYVQYQAFRNSILQCVNDLMEIRAEVFHWDTGDMPLFDGFDLHEDNLELFNGCDRVGAVPLDLLALSPEELRTKFQAEYDATAGVRQERARRALEGLGLMELAREIRARRPHEK